MSLRASSMLSDDKVSAGRPQEDRAPWRHMMVDRNKEKIILHLPCLWWDLEVGAG